ncbi:MAG: energy-coupling factor transporter transmembrane protein EcfT [Olsenella sp.]|nr:energy-coupling factor transporter transmembrane protein EcfT [Olsenella sp.]MCI1793720.1 energy-coupling factor transporter transmembrane protein EcfT [Olsenella sp.]MCI1811974.1 energy-coupling factor transporter transmembrane protein EcfT [Olsenella sp.]MCI1879142.1 energy-coupling factor transporter transmembrane protein EcfT [Olsenella sp.]
MGRASDRTPLEEAAPAGDSLPSWLVQPEAYEPAADRDGFVQKSLLSLTGVLSRLRMDDGQSTSLSLSPSAPVKLACGLAVILMTSLSSNFAFTLVVLAGVLPRTAALPPKALRRVVGVSFTAAGVSALVMVPAMLLGQSQSALLIGTKILVCVGTAMVVALSTPVHEVTGALRAFHVSNLVIMTFELALKSIVTLGKVATEVLCALDLRSVGKNRSKGTSMGGVGGVTFLKANEAARTTADAMRCRGFEGEYQATPRGTHKPIDIAWLLALAAVGVLFAYLQGGGLV